MNKLKKENGMFIIDRPVSHGLKYYAKYSILIVLDIFYKILLLFTFKKSPNKKYNISICAIFKNEANYMKEWIEFHQMMGVDHFYLYNNNSADDYFSVLSQYIEKGIVTLVEWPEVPGQLTAYKNWYENYRFETKWVSFLDLDEFICPLKDSSIDSWLLNFNKYPVVKMYWQMFGTSGILANDDNKLVTEQYLNSWGKLDTVGKVFYNTEYPIDCFSRPMMHGFSVRHLGFKIPPINQFGYFVKWDIQRFNHKERTIQVNHYWARGFKSYEDKHKRGSAAYGASWKTFDKFQWHEHFNTSSNYAIVRFITELKLRMNGNYPIND